MGKNQPGTGPVVTLLLVALAGLSTAACSVDRDRPTGPPSVLPVTAVEVSQPQTNDVVPADSFVNVEIVATGLLQSIGFVLTTLAQGDTLDQTLEPLDEPVEAIRVEFQAQIPNLPGGTSLELVGVAENVAGERTVSDPVLVLVIECNGFVVACRN